MNVRLRTRYLDDRLDEQLARGAVESFILGAGLTHAPFASARRVSYFEIDDPGMLNFKQDRLTEREIDAPINFIAGNYVAVGVLPLLEANGFRCDLPSFFIWEGNTMYLTRGAAVKVLRDIKARVRQFSISFDYMDQPVVARATETGKPRLCGALRGHGRALALRHRRSRSARRGEQHDCRRCYDDERATP